MSSANLGTYTEAIAVTTPLKAFVEEHGQNKAAQLMGITQSAVSQMLRSGRNVVVELDQFGQFVEAREIRIIRGAKAA
jgi:predicted DNA-binding protein (UPF0251 family)